MHCAAIYLISISVSWFDFVEGVFVILPTVHLDPNIVLVLVLEFYNFDIGLKICVVGFIFNWSYAKTTYRKSKIASQEHWLAYSLLRRINLSTKWIHCCFIDTMTIMMGIEFRSFRVRTKYTISVVNKFLSKRFKRVYYFQRDAEVYSNLCNC